MQLGPLDIAAFVTFLLGVIGISLYASRREKNAEDYFLAGRNLSWWLIGFSLIASNISTEHFVGMAGSGYGNLGLAVASYEWMAAVTLVVVAVFFLPRFLRSGIYTIPEYLEYRYDKTARLIMATFLMIAYVVVALASVLYSGAIFLNTAFEMDFHLAIWLLGALAGAYTIYGGLKAVVWSDLIQGIALLLGGVVITILGLRAVGGLGSFLEFAEPKLHTVLPWDHPDMPWLAVFVGGMWIPNLFYWGLNQFITQRTLGAKSLAEGQKGIFLAAFLKLLIPFIIIFPGIMALQLYPDLITKDDEAYPVLMRELLPAGLRGIMFAALFGAIMSSLDSLLNSVSTIFTMDLYRNLRKGDHSSRHLMIVGRIATGGFMIAACLWAPLIRQLGEGVFEYIQKVWGFITPGIVASFVVGIVWKRVPPAGAIGAMLLGVPIYGLLLALLPNVAFLHHMAITFALLFLWMAAVTLRNPLPEPRVFPVQESMDVTTAPGVRVLAVLLVLATAALYIIFW